MNETQLLFNSSKTAARTIAQIGVASIGVTSEWMGGTAHHLRACGSALGSLAAKHFPAAAARDFSGGGSLIAGYTSGVPGNSRGKGPPISIDNTLVCIQVLAILQMKTAC